MFQIPVKHQKLLFSKKTIVCVLFLGLSIMWWQNRKPQDQLVMETNELKLSDDPTAYVNKLDNLWQQLVPEEEREVGSNNQTGPESWSYERWSVLDNRADGYRFAYPVDYEVDYSQGGKIVVKPNNSKGLVIIYLKGEEVSIKTYSEGLSSDEETQLFNARNFIESSFERFSPEIVNYRKQ